MKIIYWEIFVGIVEVVEYIKVKFLRYLLLRDWFKFFSRWNEDYGNNFGVLVMYCVLNYIDIKVRNIVL